MSVHPVAAHDHSAPGAPWAVSVGEETSAPGVGSTAISAAATGILGGVGERHRESAVDRVAGVDGVGRAGGGEVELGVERDRQLGAASSWSMIGNRPRPNRTGSVTLSGALPGSVR